MNQWLNKMERKLGRYAIPNLMNYVVILYAVGVPYMYLILHVYMQSAKTFSALLAAMLVYVPGDTLKIIVVTALAPVLRRTLAKAVPNL